MTAKKPDDTTDFHKMAKEAAAEAYNPRAVRCWPWAHVWTMWQVDSTGNEQQRHCTGCGKIQTLHLSKVSWCVRYNHTWENTSTASRWESPKGEFPVGYTYFQQCTRCGHMRRLDL